MRKLLTCLGVMLLFAQASFSQTIEITGKLSDERGNPIPNASIQEKISKRGTVSDGAGMFKVAVKPGSTLVLSSVGFDKKEIKVDQATTLNVSLVANNAALSEVVVTGVGAATSKRKLGISVESLTSDKLPPVPAATLDQALIGKIPGAQISSVSGNPGDKVNIVLRGINTVQGGTRPLIMLDGVEIPFENMNTIDLGQVERVEVVQGAASASLYGAQGANGVIQIFTKKGVKGKLSITASSSITRNSFINAGHFGKADKHPYLTDASGNIIAAGSNSGAGLQCR